MSFKAFAIDLDGTLLVGENIHPDNFGAIKRAKEAGIEVMIATARWWHIAARIGQELGIRDLLIACSGAQVRDQNTGMDVFDHRLPLAFTRELFAICNAQRCIATVTFNDDVRIKLDGEPDPAALAPEMHWVPQLEAQASDLPRIAAIQGTGCVAAVRAELEEKYADEVNIFDSIGPTGKIIITVTAKPATKGAAVRAAADHLGIGADQVVAFGDAENDLEMFRAAGAAVAMGQADEKTRAAATFVSKPNNEGGVAYAIDRLLERGEF